MHNCAPVIRSSHKACFREGVELMQWREIRTHYPRQWLLVEAMNAHSEDKKRVLDHLAVVDTFTDSVNAIRRYQELHRQSPDRELYVFHTSREELNVTERCWMGVRA